MTIPFEIERDLRYKALRDAAWLALFNAQLLDQFQIAAVLTSLLVDIDELRNQIDRPQEGRR